MLSIRYMVIYTYDPVRQFSHILIMLMCFLDRTESQSDNHTDLIYNNCNLLLCFRSALSDLVKDSIMAKLVTATTNLGNALVKGENIFNREYKF